MWIGASGRIAYYRPRMDYVVSTLVPGIPEEIFFDRADLGAGAFVRLGSRYVRVSRGSVVSAPVNAVPPPERRLTSPTAREVFREFPALESFLPLLTRGDDLEQWPASAATMAPGRSEVWLGTRGNGLLARRSGVQPGRARAIWVAGARRRRSCARGRRRVVRRPRRAGRAGRTHVCVGRSAAMEVDRRPAIPAPARRARERARRSRANGVDRDQPRSVPRRRGRRESDNEMGRR